MPLNNPSSGSGTPSSPPVFPNYVTIGGIDFRIVPSFGALLVVNMEARINGIWRILHSVENPPESTTP